MKLLFTLLFLATIIGAILCGTYQLDADRNVGIKPDHLTNAKHRGGGGGGGGDGHGRGRGHCTGTGPTAASSPGFTPPTGLPITTRVSTLSSLLPFPPFTAPNGQTPFPNIDVRDTERV